MPCPYKSPWLSLNHVWVKLIQYMHSHPISSKSIWILPSYINFSLPSDLSPSGFLTNTVHQPWYSSVDIPIRLQDWWLRSRVSTPSGGKRFFFSIMPRLSLALCAMNNWGCLLGIKMKSRELGHALPSNAQVKNGEVIFPVSFRSMWYSAVLLSPG
jgi:hypothetical protein